MSSNSLKPNECHLIRQLLLPSYELNVQCCQNEQIVTGFNLESARDLHTFYKFVRTQR